MDIKERLIKCIHSYVKMPPRVIELGYLCAALDMLDRIDPNEPALQVGYDILKRHHIVRSQDQWSLTKAFKHPDEFSHIERKLQ